MKKQVIALALALTMAVPLAACNGGRTGDGDHSSGAGNTSTGQVARRHSSAPDYRNDGRYAAGSNGRVAGSGDSHRSRDLTRDARDFVRGTGDAAKDLGNGLRKAARDIGDGMADAAREY